LIELNSNSIEKNGMKINEKNIEKLLMNMVLNFNFLKNEDPKRHNFHASLFGNGLNIF
jgi:hypothetical protein